MSTYEIGVYFPGQSDAGATLLQFVTSRAFSLPAGLTSSLARSALGRRWIDPRPKAPEPSSGSAGRRRRPASCRGSLAKCLSLCLAALLIIKRCEIIEALDHIGIVRAERLL